MIKKSLSLFFAILVLMCFCTSAYAETDISNSAGANVIIQPCWTYISMVNNWMGIDASGKATMVSNIDAYSGVDKVEMYNYLQKLQNGVWTIVKSWSTGYIGSSATWGQTWYVAHGYNYRLKTYFYAYDGSNCETTYLISGTVYY